MPDALDRPLRLLFSALAVVFAATGLLFFLFPDGTIRFLDAVGRPLGFPDAPVSPLRFWLSLAVAYMVLVTLLAAAIARDPRDRAPLMPILAAGKATSSLTCLGYFVGAASAFVYLLNALVDGSLALVVLAAWGAVRLTDEAGSARDGARLRAVLDALVPRGGAFPIGAADTDLDAALARYFAGLHPLGPVGLRLLLLAVEYGAVVFERTPPFSKLEPGSARVDTGSFQWVATRTKYWLVALMQPVGSLPPAGIFRDILLRGAPRTGKVVDAAYARTTLPLKNSAFAFDLFVGPQSWAELHALGNDLENVNPYAGWLHPVVQPFATIVMRVLLWMKATLRVNYGWVLIIFGVAIRLLLWPLNNKAMRSSIQMQRLQPELSAIQAKYKNDPEKQRDALMKVYQDHGMSPFSPMLGCLPMLLPMPVLFALYFVFQNTIEFRGVPFLWLPDLALKDPLYIIPLVMGGSMYLLSWIGMRSSPPNPQAKMMSYMMPVMFTFLFLNFASGLNLYYAVQNIAALPQQWFLSRERVRAGVSATPALGAAAGGARAGPAARKT